MRHISTVIIGTSVSGVIVLVAGIGLGWFGFPALVAKEIKNAVVLVNGTEAYDRWRKLPVPLFFKVYIFNVTNPEEVKNGANPIVQELGPYVYDQYKEKFDIKDEGDGTYSYVENSTFYFNKRSSGNLSEDDVVTVINMALLGTVQKIKKTIGSGLPMEDILKEIFIGWNNIFQTATVKKLLWDGLTVVNCTAKAMSDTASMACEMLKPRLPVTIAEYEPGIFKLAFFRHKNNSNDGQFRVNSGIEDYRKLGRIIAWKGQSNLTNWDGEFCNRIDGTDSTIFPPFRSSHDKVVIFLTDLCRSMYAEFDSYVTWRGVRMMYFPGSPLNLKAAADYPPNICFCEHIEDEPPQCLKSGVLDVFNCQGVSVIVSSPHFYNASTEYQSYVQGLNPDREKHETFIYIEPQTGVVLRGSKRIQLNMFLTQMEEMSVLHNVSEGLFPLLWAEEGVDVDVDDKNLASVQRLFTVLYILDVVKWLLVAAGVLLMCVSAYMCAFKRKNGNRIKQREANDRAVVTYDNKAYLHKSDDMKDKLSISDISDIIHNEQIGIKNRRFNRFPGKSQSRFEQDEANRNVTLGVSGDRNKTVTLSNVFM